VGLTSSEVSKREVTDDPVGERWEYGVGASATPRSERSPVELMGEGGRDGGERAPGDSWEYTGI